MKIWLHSQIANNVARLRTVVGGKELPSSPVESVRLSWGTLNERAEQP